VRGVRQLFSMITRVFSAAVVGIDATEIEIEVNTGAGIPQIVVEPCVSYSDSLCFLSSVQS